MIKNFFASFIIAFTACCAPDDYEPDNADSAPDAQALVDAALLPDTNYANERDANVPPEVIDCTGNLEPCTVDSDCLQPKVQMCVESVGVCWDPRCSGTP